MSAEATLRPLLAKYIREEDSLNTAFAEPTTDLFSLGFDSMGPSPCSMISPLRGLLWNLPNWWKTPPSNSLPAASPNTLQAIKTTCSSAARKASPP